MKTSIAIQFRCPNCNQKFQSNVLSPGSDYQCSVCDYKFKVPGDPVTKTISEDEPVIPEQTVAQPDVITGQILSSAHSANLWGNILLGLAGFCFCGILAAKQKWVIPFMLGFGFLFFGLAVKIIAQLLFIRAELRIKK
jgi:DNA-directed RNA polymerase subunit RPC12/RpoP